MKRVFLATLMFFLTIPLFCQLTNPIGPRATKADCNAEADNFYRVLAEQPSGLMFNFTHAPIHGGFSIGSIGKDNKGVGFSTRNCGRINSDGRISPVSMVRYFDLKGESRTCELTDAQSEYVYVTRSGKHFRELNWKRIGKLLKACRKGNLPTWEPWVIE